MSVTDRIGREAPVFEVTVEPFQLRLFAKAIGETRREYLDPAAARAMGYRDLPAPPTFAFSLAMRPQDPFDLLRLLDVDLARVLHGEQSFEYFEPICAGDRVRVSRRVVEAYEKKGGALQFYVAEVRCDDAATERTFCTARQTIAVRAKEA